MPRNNPKSVQPEGDESAQAENTLSNPQTPSSEDQYPERIPGSVDLDHTPPDPDATPDAPYGDPSADPAELPVASDPDPAVDPMVSQDAAQPIGTGSESQAIAERNKEVFSPELEHEDNPRIHGRHHERHLGRPLESISQDAPYPLDEKGEPVDKPEGKKSHRKDK
jgi:hypothetical protein